MNHDLIRSAYASRKATPSTDAVAPHVSGSTPTSARSSAGTSIRRPGCPFWLERAKTLDCDPRERRQGLRRPRQVRLLPGRVAARRAGAALGAEGATPTSRSTSSRPAAAPACRSRASASTTSASTTRTSATRCPTTRFPKGADWLMVGPSGPRRLRLAVEHLAQHRGGICFMVDLDPRWVIKLIKMRPDGAGGGLQAARHRSGADAAARARQHQVPVHHAEAARGALREGLAEEDGHHAASSAAAPR